MGRKRKADVSDDLNIPSGIKKDSIVTESSGVNLGKQGNESTRKKRKRHKRDKEIEGMKSDSNVKSSPKTPSSALEKPAVAGKKKKRDTEKDDMFPEQSSDLKADDTRPDVKKSKKKRKDTEEEDMFSGQSSDLKVDDTESNVSEQPEFPYPTEADDHCESPKEAYVHIQPLLHSLRKTDQSPFLIYDPYYCDGAVRNNFEELGFPQVYNKKEDCYHVWSGKDLPKFDIMVTNPPYSGDHMEKLMRFITSPVFGDRPWFLLLPNWVHKKDFFLAAVQNITPFYLVPRKRYVYLPPKGFREAKKSDIHKKSSPFISMWYIWGGTKAKNEGLMRCFLNSKGSGGVCELARSKSALRDLRRKKR
mmetsp:Transcript_20722/g.26749  ORF Transcript_20722/g.26749 Transcript_20722/m.26749 type:complete len:361 (-) Transcript_20722:29-1111(-)